MKPLVLLVFFGSFAASANELSFNRDIRPILAENCYYCHGPDPNHRKADLRLDDREVALKKEAIAPGKPEESGLVDRIFTEDESDLMPPPDTHKKLSAEEKQTLRRWVAEGAKYEGHWAFLRPVAPPVPDSGQGNPIDAFVRQRLAKEGLTLQPQADPRTLLRRVTLDLTGLPPSPDAADAFVSACAQGQGDAAYEAAVDRLLASTAYGEHMTRYWLDYARYGDSHGFEKDSARTMWPWRDWVIQAFNANKPFDQFTVEQLAGDLLPNPTQDQIIATGFNRNHRINAEGGALAEEWRIENIIDRVSTTSSTWLGLTMGCARCHDHKFDPITQKEFYEMCAFFGSVDETGTVGALSGNQKPLLSLANEEQNQQLAKLDQAVKNLGEKKSQLLAAQAERKKGAAPAETTQASTKAETPPPSLEAQLKSVEDEIKKATSARNNYENSLPSVMVMHEAAKPVPSRILIRGQYNNPGEEVHPNTPAVLPPLPAGAPRNRLTFAQWLTASNHPLTARVWVNRQWERFFGLGLVMSSDNLGVQCDAPSHSELLDWLATEFIRQGWDMKALQKLMVMSATYRQSSSLKTIPGPLRTKDPQNRLLAYAPRIRLSGEALRDQALAVSGLLDPKAGGPSVRPYMPPNVWDETSVYGDLRNYQPDLKNGLYRRTLYTIWKRTAAPPTLQLFDAPSREVCTVKRGSTNTPLQALALLNEVTFVEAARVLAQRMMQDGGSSPENKIEWGFRRVTQRPPQPKELQTLTGAWKTEFAQYRSHPDTALQLVHNGNAPVPQLDPPELAAYTVVANVLLNLDEIITRE
jgi:hypothetical protein